MKESISFLSTYAATDRQEEPQWYQKLPIFTFSQRWGFHNFVWIGKRESLSLFFVGFIVVVEGNYASAACDFDDIWAYYVCYLQIADCYFSCNVIRELFPLSSRLVPATDCFPVMLLMVFSLIGLVCTRCCHHMIDFVRYVAWNSLLW